MSSFKFDPNSTKNEGRWRLRDPDKFSRMWTKTDTGIDGVNYIVGYYKDENNTYTIQAIRFKKNVWTEEKAREWWEKNKKKYIKLWTESDWDKWKEKKAKEEERKEKRVYITRRKGLSLSRKLIKSLDLEYYNPDQVGLDFRWKKNIGIPVGSLRRGKKEIGDIDIIITKQMYKEEIKDILNLEKISGGEKRIDFVFEGVNINIFIFLDARVFGASLLHSTGPFDYNIRLRNKVRKEGNKLSQNGLEIDGEIVSTPTERILQKKIGIHEREPRER